ncbi:MAG: glycosyltransferase family 9 protein [Ignavibacteria bacterium]|nr:glycosyltransferase family 9 protein [Ignavibacteria bacterium]
MENDNIFEIHQHVRLLMHTEYIDLFKDYSGKIQIIPFQHNRYRYSLLYKVKLLKSFRKSGYGLCINLTAARGIINDELSILSGAKTIYALNAKHTYLGEKLGTLLDKFYTQILTDNIFNEYDKHIALLNMFNKNAFYKIKFANQKTFSTNYDLIKHSTLKKSIVIAPFSSERNRDWPIKYFTKIIHQLNSEFQIYLIGNKEQENELKMLRNGLQNVIILASELKLYEIPSLIARSDLFIGIDSGISHIALRLDVKLLAIIGGGMFGQFLPFNSSKEKKFIFYDLPCFNCAWKCSQKEMYCITKIMPEKIIQVINELLDVQN